MEDKIQISAIIPALNEEDNIETVINKTLNTFLELGIKGEIIVINDGSTDKTEELVNKIIKTNNRIRMIKHDKPQGIGVSFWDGVDNAKADAVVMLPGDNENEPWEILRYSDLLEHVDMVVPFIINKRRSILRNLLATLYRIIINITFSVNFNYTNGTVLYKKSLLEELNHRAKGFFFQTDILVKLAKKGYLFAEVPCKVGIRTTGESKSLSLLSLYLIIKEYLRLIRDCYFKRSKCQS